MKYVINKNVNPEVTDNYLIYEVIQIDNKKNIVEAINGILGRKRETLNIDEVKEYTLTGYESLS